MIKKENYLHLSSDIQSIADRNSMTFDNVVEQLSQGELVEMEHTDNKNIAAKIALDHLKEDIAYYVKLKSVEMRNAKEMPKVYYCKHIQAGVAKYDDEMVLIENDTLKKMMPSMVGIAVTVYHERVKAEDIEKKADGYVVESFYNSNDGWFWLKFIAVSDACHQAVNNNWSVSNAYIPNEYNQGGEWHNVKYDREILDAYYTQLAIVPDPRYEGACIMTCEEYKKYNEKLKNELEEYENSKSKEIKNSKTGGKKMIKFFKFKKEEITNADDLSDACIELANGKTVKVSEMVNAVEEADKEKEQKCNESAEISVGDKKMTVKELKNKYEAAMAAKEKKNEDDKDDEEKKNQEDEEKKNQDDEKKKKEDEEKKNAKNFDPMKKKIKEGEDPAELSNSSGYETRDEKLKRGSERY